MKKTINHYMAAAGLAMSVLALGACNDEWDDHYDVQGIGAGGNVSLWQTITANEELTNFARVLEACGYQSKLAGDQVFTVFAPKNSGFSAQQADSVIALYEREKSKGIITKDNKAIKEFVQNHIALYNHSVAQEGKDTSIVMMNGKYLSLGYGQFAGQTLTSRNTLTKNGILFTTEQSAHYLPNVFEYLGTDAALDSLSKFLYSYNNYKFDPDQSVPGEIVDGQTTYLDSVKVLENVLLDTYFAPINNEDSTYWMVVPDNSEWERLLTQYRPYFNYNKRIANRDSLAYLYSHLFIPNGSVFSMGWNTEQSFNDSAYSVNARPYSMREKIYGFADAKYYVYDKPFEPGGAFYGAEKIQCSNGVVLKVPQWNIQPTQTFLWRIKVEAESAGYRKEYDESAGRTPTFVTVVDTSEFYNKVSNHAYLEILSQSKDSKPSVTYYIPDIFSNVPYDIKLVMAPALAGDPKATEEQRKKLLVDVTLGYEDKDGVEQTTMLKRRFECKQDVVDTIMVAENYVFETCTFEVDPQVTLKVASSGRPPGSSKDQYQTSLRIDCIILEPKVGQ